MTEMVLLERGTFKDLIDKKIAYTLVGTFLLLGLVVGFFVGDLGAI